MDEHARTRIIVPNLRAMVRDYSLRTFLYDLGSWTALFGPLFVLTVLAGWLVWLWLAIVVAIVGGLVCVAVWVLALMYEEDWWNDLVGQNTMILICVCSTVAAPTLGIWLGARLS